MNKETILTSIFLVCASYGFSQSLKKPNSVQEIHSLIQKEYKVVKKDPSTTTSTFSPLMTKFNTVSELKAHVKIQNKTTVASKNTKEQKRPKNILVAPKTVSEIQSLKSN
jgi:hypothetical protein